MRSWISLIVFALLAAGCAAPRTATPPAKRQPSGFASADAKNVHDFLIRYQTIIAGDDVKAILRLYVDGARMVPYLVDNRKVLTKKDMETRLPYITQTQRKADMRLVFREPMDIKVNVSGERANVQATADLTWQERGAPNQAVLDCYFRLERIDYVWKIRESHQEVAVPGRSAAPAAASGSGGGQFSDTPDRPIIPTGDQHPRPLF